MQFVLSPSQLAALDLNPDAQGGGTGSKSQILILEKYLHGFVL